VETPFHDEFLDVVFKLCFDTYIAADMTSVVLCHVASVVLVGEFTKTRQMTDIYCHL